MLVHSLALILFKSLALSISYEQVLTQALRKASNRELRRNIRGAIGGTYQSFASEA